MSIIYELWDSDGANLINAYDAEADALARVRQAVARQGPAVVATWVLLADDDEADDARLIAQGEALANLALAGADGQAPKTALP